MSSRSGCRYLFAIAVLVVAFLVTAKWMGYFRVANVREAITRNEASNRVSQVMLALHEYEDAFEQLPNAATVDAEGRRLHSWRTLILPFMGMEASHGYRKLDLAKAWNDPVNRDVTMMEIADYESPRGRRHGKPGLTNIVAVVGPDTVIREQGAVTIDAIPDGASKTGVLIEFTDSEIGWAEPRDVTIDEAVRIIQGFDGDQGVVVALADGHPITIPSDTSADDIRKLFNCSDGSPPEFGAN